MKVMSVVLMALAFLCFATLASAQEKKAETKIVLPEAVVKAVTENCPNTEISKTEMEKEAGITLYDVELKAARVEIEVTEDGTVLEFTTFIEMADVPAAAAAVIQKAAAGSAIKEIEKAEQRAEIKKEGKIGHIVRLANPSLAYEVEIAKDKRTGEIKVAPDGKIVKPLKWRVRGAEKD